MFASYTGEFWSGLPSCENTIAARLRYSIEKAKAFKLGHYRLAANNQRLAAFWYNPSSPMPTNTNMKVLISRAQIAEGVARIGHEITRDFAGQSVILVGVLKGACLFLSDLARQIELDATFDFIAVRSYGTQKESAGEVQLIKDVTTPLEDKNVILVEDILDTGLTFSFLRKLLMARKPRTLKFAALLDKPSRRQMPVQADYVGFQIPDVFVVGYGLDYAERFRNLPDICVFSEAP
jgi:hypoxanthine phosphoribosyltransferase